MKTETLAIMLMVATHYYASSILDSMLIELRGLRKFLLPLIFIFLGARVDAQSGSVDPMFGENGFASTGFGRSEARAYAIAIQSDGKILCGGSAFKGNSTREYQRDSYSGILMRYNTDGGRDTSFGNNGIVVNQQESQDNEYAVNSGIYYIKVLEDGRILTYGYQGVNVQYGGLQLTMYHSNGSLDMSFGNNGYVYSTLSPNNVGTPLVIQADNKIVVLGGQYQSSTNANQNTALFRIERYNQDGSLDTAFGTEGQVLTSFGFLLNYPGSLALQSDGKIIASGSGSTQLLLARYTTNGTLDNTFDGDGRVVTTFGIANNSVFVGVLPDGKIQSAGTSYTSAGIHFAITQYNTNGTLDLTFDGDGRSLAIIEVNDVSNSIVDASQQSDGKFIVCTVRQPMNEYDNPEDFVTRRYNADGTIDNAFGTNGRAIAAFGLGSIAKRAFQRPDGKILLVGHSHHLLGPTLSVVEVNVLLFNNNGTIDDTFNGSGIVREKFESSNDNGRILLKQNDGKLLLIGAKRNNPLNVTATSEIALARYNQDGSLDEAFGDGGKTIYNFDQQIISPKRAAFQTDGKILVVYELYVFPSTTGQEIIRFNTDGSLDSSFGTNGKVIVSTSYASALLGLHVDTDGDFFIVNHGYSPIENGGAFGLYLTHFTAIGQVDSSFGTNGTVYFDGIFYSSPDPDIVVQSDGKVVVSLTEQNSSGSAGLRLIRLNADGSADVGFENEILVIDALAYAHAVFIEPNGKFIVAGTSTASNGFFVSYNFVTARYHADGSLDLSYGTNGYLKTMLEDPFGWVYNIVSSVIRQTDGKFLVGLTRNDQTPSNVPFGLYDFAVYRFNNQGEYDSDFGVSGKVFTSMFTKYDEVFSMVLQDDNKIVLAGTTDNGFTRDFALVRLENCIDVNSEVHVTLCSGESYSLNNVVYSESGMYTSTLSSVQGCDSIVTLNLSVLPFSGSIHDAQVCFGESWEFNGLSYGETGSYTSILTSANGCDSIAILNLSVLPQSVSALNVELCPGDAFSINGETYTETGVYQSSMMDLNGCESALLTTITVDNLLAQIMSSEQDLTAINYPDSASFQWVNCDSDLSPIVGQTSAVFTPVVDGNFAVIVSNGVCSETSSCEEFAVVGLPSLLQGNDFSVAVFPNPFRNQFVLDVSSGAWPYSYLLFDAYGHEVSSGQVFKETTVIALNSLATGMYGLQVEDSRGNRVICKIIKE